MRLGYMRVLEYGFAPDAKLFIHMSTITVLPIRSWTWMRAIGLPDFLHRRHDAWR